MQDAVGNLKPTTGEKVQHATTVERRAIFTWTVLSSRTMMMMMCLNNQKRTWIAHPLLSLTKKASAPNQKNESLLHNVMSQMMTIPTMMMSSLQSTLVFVQC